MPSFFRYVEPTKPEAASGLVSAVYTQLRRDFGRVAEPISLHAPVPELLAASWMVLRESTLVGSVPRGAKEMVATAISQANRCPWCVDIHDLLIRAAGSSQAADAIVRRETATIDDPVLRRLVQWAAATGQRDSPELLHPPFGAAEAPELIGTTTIFHYVNRVVSVLLVETFIPQPGLMRSVVRRTVPRFLGGLTRRSHQPGESLSFLPAGPLPAELAWSVPAPHVALAFARWAAAYDAAGKRYLSPELRAIVDSRLSTWDGSAPGLSRQWVEQLVNGYAPPLQTSARLALLTALAAYQVDDEVVNAFRAYNSDPATLTALVAWSAYCAARRIASWCAVPFMTRLPTI